MHFDKTFTTSLLTDSTRWLHKRAFGMLHLKQPTPTKQHKIHSGSFKWTKKKISNNGISIKKKQRCIINNNANHISTSRRWKRKRKRKQRKNSPWSIKQQTYTKTHGAKQIEKTYNKRTKNRTQKHSRAHSLHSSYILGKYYMHSHTHTHWIHLQLSWSLKHTYIKTFRPDSHSEHLSIYKLIVFIFIECFFFGFLLALFHILLCAKIHFVML